MLFSAKIYLCGLFLIPVIIILFILYSREKNKRLERFGEAGLVNKLIPIDTWERQRIKMVVWGAGLFFLLIGLAGPQFGTKLTEVKRRGIDVIIAIDTSLSMLCEDIRPNRITQAKFELGNLITELEGNRIGIIAFSGSSFLQCPLTLDVNAARMFLNFLDVGIIPEPGTNIGSAIKLAINTFSKKERKHKALVILSDGEDYNSEAIKAAHEAKKTGVNIFTIGFGTREGSVIPIKDENNKIIDYKKDRAGKTVISKLDDKLLKKIAFLTDGKYYYSGAGNIGSSAIAEKINGLDKKELDATFRSRYEERFYYFVIIGFLLLLFEFMFKETRVKEVK